jgi:cell division protein FtsZ
MIPVDKDLISKIVFYEPSEKIEQESTSDSDTITNNLLRQVYGIFIDQSSRAVNIDLFDLGFILKHSGNALLGLADAKGQDRALQAISKALQRNEMQISQTSESPMALLAVISGKNAELEMDELTEMTEYLQEQLGEQTEVIFGHSESSKLNDEVRVMVVVAAN